MRSLAVVVKRLAQRGCICHRAQHGKGCSGQRTDQGRAASRGASGKLTSPQGKAWANRWQRNRCVRKNVGRPVSLMHKSSFHRGTVVGTTRRQLGLR